NDGPAGWVWTILAGVCFVAALLLKFHACVPVIVGAVVAPAIVNRAVRTVHLHRVFVALVIGLILLACWGVPVRIAARSSNVVPDTGGIDESLHRVMITVFGPV